MQTALTFIFVFVVIVVVHEFGHFYFAKKSGILVREFAIGMGPKIFYHRAKDGTAYTIRLLPLGGYVRMAGLGDDETEIYPGTPMTVELDEEGKIARMNLSTKVQLTNGIPMEVVEIDLDEKLFLLAQVVGNDEEVRYDVRKDATVIEKDGTELLIAPREVQFQSAKVWQRILTNFAGPMNNFILGIVVFIIITFIQGGVQDLNSNKLGEIMPDSPAQKAGLKEGDELLTIEGVKIANWEDLTNQIQPNPNKPLKMEVKTSKGVKTLTITPKQSPDTKEKSGMIGIMPPFDSSVSGKVFGGFKRAMTMSLAIFKGIGGLFTAPSLNKLGGPVMMFKMSEQASQQGFVTVLSLMAMLSMNLGFMNLLPIPALDGGKIVLNIIEAIRKKPLSQEKEGILTLIGVGFIVALMIMVTWNDITRFFFK
ncbi:regulator of sigma E protease [Pilibacter termitis]|uniref:Zinc metalloprotease n=1 Tax=Pilibacter termitis TaxID=263852 RepID=A0A1T4N8L1_9ENTE|nr:RIP metalloprotease RseP [Pilibacter termitis]SJZ75188.1 regulator of sigma E protease [Pilibacter termitis]